jgi:ABC-2 type transport system ATP-binding protein
MTETAAIKIRDLTKRYPGTSTPALAGLSLTIKTGQVYGFLGSNGAGKSTTIRTLLNFLRPTSGSVSILGLDSVENATEIHRSIGYLAGDVALPKNVTARQLLRYLGKLHGNVDNAYLSDLVQRFGVTMDQKIGTRSKGYRQKIGLLQAFMHKPQILVLDEPTSGLDPLMQEQFYALVKEAKERGAAVFLSSHNFAEAERVCDRVAIIRSGKLVADQSVADMRREHPPTWHVTLKDKADAKKLTAAKALDVTPISAVTFAVRPAGSISEALTALGKVDVLSINQGDNELEDEFMTFYSKDGAE